MQVPENGGARSSQNGWAMDYGHPGQVPSMSSKQDSSVGTLLASLKQRASAKLVDPPPPQEEKTANDGSGKTYARYAKSHHFVPSSRTGSSGMSEVNDATANKEEDETTFDLYHRALTDSAPINSDLSPIRASQQEQRAFVEPRLSIDSIVSLPFPPTVVKTTVTTGNFDPQTHKKETREEKEKMAAPLGSSAEAASSSGTKLLPAVSSVMMTDVLVHENFLSCTD